MSMTDGDALLAAILAHPEADDPRLMYADWLQENGHEERAEFIRVQCELARHPQQANWLEQMPVEQWEGSEEEGKLLRRLDPLVRRHFELCRLYVRDCGPWSREFIRGVLGKDWLQLSASWEWGWSRGFVSEVTCTAADWLAHADSLCWHPGQTVECENCDGTGTVGRDCGYSSDGPCGVCPGGRWESRDDPGDRGYTPGTGRVPRPRPPTAQPITRVVLTTDMEAGEADGWMRLAAGEMLRVTRVPGEDAPGGARAVAKWTLEREWPGVTFELPPVPGYGPSPFREAYPAWAASRANRTG